MEYLSKNLSKEERKSESKVDEFLVLHRLLDDVLEKLGWSLCFITEDELYLQNLVTEELNNNHGDLYSRIEELEFYFLSIVQMEIMKNQYSLI